MSRIVDLTDRKFGRLAVVGLSEKRSNHGALWDCVCDCGKTACVLSQVLRRGKSNSCGCYRIEAGGALGRRSRRHGEAGTSTETVEYRTWAQMLSRTRSGTHVNFKNYGGRGITVCERWKKYENFLADMGRRPSPKHSLDRKDNDKGYDPDNCRWATIFEQNRNTRGNHRITIRGETKTLAEWMEIAGRKAKTFQNRIQRGMSEENALFAPLQVSGRKSILEKQRHRSS